MKDKNNHLNQLNNGLSVHLSNVSGIESVTVLVAVKAGSIYEVREQMGISHFLEHLVGKGTKNFPKAIDIALAVDNVGGIHNAFTSTEYTGFYVKVPADQLEVALKIVSDLVFYPQFPKDEFEKEKGVVLEEINMYEDEPRSQIAEKFSSLLFGDNPLGWPVLGNSDTVKNLSRDQVKEYWQYLYTPNRMTLSIAGKIPDYNKTNSLISKYFSYNEQQTILPETNFKVSQDKLRIQNITKDTQQTHMFYGYPTSGWGDKDKKNPYTLSVINSVLGGNMSSRLFTEIREKRGLAYYVGSYAQLYKDNGYIAMVAGSGHDSAAQVLDLARQQFLYLANNDLSAQELNKAKNYLKGQTMLAWESSSNLAELFAKDLLLRGCVRYKEEIVKAIESISLSDVRKLAQKLFLSQKQNLSAIGPKKIVDSFSLK